MTHSGHWALAARSKAAIFRGLYEAWSSRGHMRRRDFITLLSGAAIWPLTAHAQQPERMRRIGVVTGFTEADMRPLIVSLRNRLQELGWSQGRNIEISEHFTAGDYDRMVTEAGKLVASSPDVILALGSPGLSAVRQHTRTVPVVFMFVADPVELGFIDSLARPGGNATGLTNFELSMGGKWLTLLKTLDAQITHVALIANPANTGSASFARLLQTIGPSLGIEVVTASVRNATDIEAAISAVAQHPGGGLLVFPDSVAIVNRDLIINLTARHRVPAIYPFRIFATSGGLLSYGLNFTDVFRQAADYVDRILRGAKPGELPVQAPTKYELLINLKTATALGLTVSPAFLTLADEVIE
jgi:putative ABC transport system substrate-binding protein